MRSLSPSEQRMVAVALLVAVAAGAWLGFVSPVLSGFAARAQTRAGLLQTYERNRRLLQGLPVWRVDLNAQRASAQVYSVAAASAEDGQEKLKARLTAVLAATGAGVGASETAPAPLPGWVAARADAELTLAQFRTAVSQLENGQPHVAVEYVSLAAERAATTGHAGPLQLRLEVSAPLSAPAARRP